MAPRTPNRPAAASEPYITLSVSRNAASTLAQNLGLSTSSPQADRSVSINKTKKSPSKKVIQQKKQKSDKLSLTIDATPVTERKGHSISASSSPSSLPNGIKSEHEASVREPPLLCQQHAPIEKQQAATSNEQRFQTPANHILRDNQGLIGAQNERRSSTASLTDNGMRSSGRARKLTSKAQALAGTNFLPSLQNSPDTRSSPSQHDTNHSPEQPMVIDGRENNQRKDTPESIVGEAPLQSVETPAVRTSARERKPTTRAIELEHLKTSRKRPASPSFVERASKVAKISPSTSNRSSKLRQSSVTKERETELPTLTTAQAEQVQGAQDIEMKEPDHTEPNKPALQDPIDDKDRSPPQTLALEDPPENSQPTIQKQPPVDVAGHDEIVLEVTNQDVANQHESQISATNQETNQQPMSPPEPVAAVDFTTDPSTDLAQRKIDRSTCDLKCLSPSARLLAFAMFAANLPDSEDDSDIEDDLDKILEDTSPLQEESGNFMSELGQQYCRCPLRNASLVLNAIKADSLVLPPKVEEAVAPGSINSPVVANTVEEEQAANSRRSTRDKAPSSRYRPEMPAIKRQKIKHKKPTLLRQSSSFEQRMQNDYIAAKAEQAPWFDKLKRIQNAGMQHESNQAVSRSYPAWPNSDGVEPSKISSINGVSVDTEARSNPRIESTGTLQVTVVSKSALPLVPPTTGASVVEPTQSSEQQPMGSILQASTSAKTSEDKDKTKSAAKVHGKTGGDKPEHLKPQIHKQNSMIAPPQAKSIKLRFTTAAK